MTTLLSAEKYKLLRSKAFYIILGCFSVMTAFIVLNLVNFSHHVFGKDGVYAPAISYNFIIFCFPAFIGYFAATEFQNGTIRNALCIGKGRLAVYLSKTIAVFAGIAAMILLISVVSTVGYSAASGFGDITMLEYTASFLRAFLLQVVYFSAIASVITMLAFISRTPIMTMILGEGFIIISLIFQQGLVDNLAFLAGWFPDYYLKQLLQPLLGRGAAAPAVHVQGIAVSLAWIAVTTLITMAVFKRKDLK